MGLRYTMNGHPWKETHIWVGFDLFPPPLGSAPGASSLTGVVMLDKTSISRG